MNNTINLTNLDTAASDIHRATLLATIDYDDGRRIEWQHSLAEVANYEFNNLADITAYAQAKADELATIPTFGGALIHINIRHERLPGMLLTGAAERSNCDAPPTPTHIVINRESAMITTNNQQQERIRQ